MTTEIEQIAREMTKLAGDVTWPSKRAKSSDDIGIAGDRIDDAGDEAFIVHAINHAADLAAYVLRVAPAIEALREARDEDMDRLDRVSIAGLRQHVDRILAAAEVKP